MVDSLISIILIILLVVGEAYHVEELVWVAIGMAAATVLITIKGFFES